MTIFSSRQKGISDPSSRSWFQSAGGSFSNQAYPSVAGSLSKFFLGADEDQAIRSDIRTIKNNFQEASTNTKKIGIGLRDLSKKSVKDTIKTGRIYDEDRAKEGENLSMKAMGVDMDDFDFDFDNVEFSDSAGEVEDFDTGSISGPTEEQEAKMTKFVSANQVIADKRGLSTKDISQLSTTFLGGMGRLIDVNTRGFSSLVRAQAAKTEVISSAQSLVIERYGELSKELANIGRTTTVNTQTSISRGSTLGDLLIGNFSLSGITSGIASATDMLSFLPMILGGLGEFAANPAYQGLRLGIRSLIRHLDTENRIRSFNESIRNLPLTIYEYFYSGGADSWLGELGDKLTDVPLVGRLVDKIKPRDDSSWGKKLITSIFGDVDEGFTDEVDTRNRIKKSAKVDYDGEAHNALNIVIPGYLQEIDRVTGGSEVIYSYERGVWETASSAKTSAQQESQKYALSSNYRLRTLFEKYTPWDTDTIAKTMQTVTDNQIKSVELLDNYQNTSKEPLPDSIYDGLKSIISEEGSEFTKALSLNQLYINHYLKNFREVTGSEVNLYNKGDLQAGSKSEAVPATDPLTRHVGNLDDSSSTLKTSLGSYLDRIDDYLFNNKMDYGKSKPDSPSGVSSDSKFKPTNISDVVDRFKEMVEGEEGDNKSSISSTFTEYWTEIKDKFEDNKDQNESPIQEKIDKFKEKIPETWKDKLQGLLSKDQSIEPSEDQRLSLQEFTESTSTSESSNTASIKDKLNQLKDKISPLLKTNEEGKTQVDTDKLKSTLKTLDISSLLSGESSANLSSSEKLGGLGTLLGGVLGPLQAGLTSLVSRFSRDEESEVEENSGALSSKFSEAVTRAREDLQNVGSQAKESRTFEETEDKFDTSLSKSISKQEIDEEEIVPYSKTDTEKSMEDLVPGENDSKSKAMAKPGFFSIILGTGAFLLNRLRGKRDGGDIQPLGDDQYYEKKEDDVQASKLQQATILMLAGPLLALNGLFKLLTSGLSMGKNAVASLLTGEVTNTASVKGGRTATDLLTDDTEVLASSIVGEDLEIYKNISPLGYMEALGERESKDLLTSDLAENMANNPKKAARQLFSNTVMGGLYDIADPASAGPTSWIGKQFEELFDAFTMKKIRDKLGGSSAESDSLNDQYEEDRNPYKAKPDLDESQARVQSKYDQLIERAAANVTLSDEYLISNVNSRARPAKQDKMPAPVKEMKPSSDIKVGKTYYKGETTPVGSKGSMADRQVEKLTKASEKKQAQNYYGTIDNDVQKIITNQLGMLDENLDPVLKEKEKVNRKPTKVRDIERTLADLTYSRTLAQTDPNVDIILSLKTTDSEKYLILRDILDILDMTDTSTMEIVEYLDAIIEELTSRKTIIERGNTGKEQGNMDISEKIEAVPVTSSTPSATNMEDYITSRLLG